MVSDLSEMSATNFEKSISNKALTKESYKTDYEWKIIWQNVIIFAYTYLAGFYGLYMLCFQAKYQSVIWLLVVGLAASMGVTAGAHRLWAHRSYKAKWPMRFILMIFQTIAFQESIYKWARDHRVHHKFTDTDADPYNSRRGFFFSHIGWLLIRHHPDVASKGATIDCSDLMQDPFVAFQKKWYTYLMLLCCFIIPTLVPWWAWNESLWCSWNLVVCRYLLNLNSAFSVNSVAHMWGMKPYDKSLSSTDNTGVAIVAFGEGWHNYHHVFPWDYKTGELGNYALNCATAFIDFCAYLGLAYDLKTVPADIIKKRVLRNGKHYFTNPYNFLKRLVCVHLTVQINISCKLLHKHERNIYIFEPRPLKNKTLSVNNILQLSVSITIIAPREADILDSWPSNSKTKMAPNILSTNPKILTEKVIQKEDSSAAMKIHDENGIQNKSEIYTKPEGRSKTELKWLNIIFIGFLHLYFVYACFTFKFLENLKTTAWIFGMVLISGLGVTAGVHRLWTHQAYKAKWPLRIILVVFYASSGMNNLYDWVRDHRVHHKYTDTDADPHNSTRGFFFSHVGWLMMKKHPEVIRKGGQIDMSDILADPIATFSCKYFNILKFIFAFLLPVMVPVYGWNETWYRAFISQIIIRYTLVLNGTWSVNSAAHIWGSKPYDSYINPTENRWVSIITNGEGWHNYHHVFPWDYKAAELQYSKLATTNFINFFAKIGWAYDLKQPSQELVKTIAMKKGDGSHPLWSAVPYPASKID
ncbi:uncharacterized protein LOC143904916 [Temnothorax americanus]|uniref:uncharacterized protein LOC143904916 n=1 Tax=Temnothorax americanus TaxID=1964332 RepID=UPI004068BC5E